MRVKWHEENIVNRKAWALCGFVCAAVGGVCGFVFAVQCLAQHQCCCVGCVGGDSRRVTPGCPFRTRLLSLWALMVLHLGGCGRVGYCQH